MPLTTASRGLGFAPPIERISWRPRCAPISSAISTSIISAATTLTASRITLAKGADPKISL
jgi:hypothetical protein